MKPRHRLGWHHRFGALLLGLCMLLSVGSPLRAAEVAADNRGPGTRAMATLLASLVNQGNPLENKFQNLRRIEYFQSILTNRPTPKQELQARFQLTAELLQVNRMDESLAEIERLRTMAKSIGIRMDENNDVTLSLREALNYMRRAELANCISNHTADSCILPLRGGGVYKVREDARLAKSVLEGFMQRYPDNLSGRWLYTIVAMTLGEYPDQVPAKWLIPPSVFASDYDIGRFTDVASFVGLDRTELSGGALVDDFDGDGHLDVVSSSFGPADPMRFYHNLGTGRFEDRTREAGLIGLTGGLNMVHADYDNDGDLDILVLRGAWMGEGGRYPNSLLRNDGGHFEDVTQSAGMLSFHPTQTAVWWDYDGDGWLDVFIGNESFRGAPEHRCELYRNNRNGTFSEVAALQGVDVLAYVKGCTSIDFNNDGRPDLFLTLLDGKNRLFRNEGPEGSITNGIARWKFTDVAEAAGVANQSFTFPCWSFDYDNDGFEDLYVSGYRIQNLNDLVADTLGQPSKGERTKLYRNRGDGTFEDVSKAVGLDRVLHAMGSNFGDLDNDGWLDFYLGTGDPNFATLIPNRMFRNDAGKRFQDVTTSGGFGNIQKGHAVAFADLDNDGDQDVYEDLGGAFLGDQYPNTLLENPGHGNHWIKLKLDGRKANRGGVGARLRIVCATPAGERVYYRTCNTGGSFGGNPLRLEIGLGAATAVKALEITWPGSGTRQVVQLPKVDAAYEVTEGDAEPRLLPLKAFTFSRERAAPHAHVESAPVRK